MCDDVAVADDVGVVDQQHDQEQEKHGVIGSLIRAME